MPVTTRRLAIAGVLTATAVAVPVAALAGNDPPSKAPAAAAQSVKSPALTKHRPPRADVPLPAVAARLASLLGVSDTAAGHALQQLQSNGSRAGLAAVARQLGVTPVQLNAALREVKMSFGSASSGQPSNANQKGAPHGRSLTAAPGAAAALASRLGVSLSAARSAMHQIGVLAAQNGGGITSDSRQLAAIAHQLGVSRAELNSALRVVKESFAGQK